MDGFQIGTTPITHMPVELGIWTLYCNQQLVGTAYQLVNNEFLIQWVDGNRLTRARTWEEVKAQCSALSHQG